MQLKQLFNDDDAVSPVIGVILMVAITVILAAVIGTFVLGLGKNVQNTSPTASITFEQSAANSPSSITIAHDSGDPLEEGNINLVYSEGGLDSDATNWAKSNEDDGKVTAGETVTVSPSGSSDFSEGETVKVVWSTDGGESSSVLAEYEVS